MHVKYEGDSLDFLLFAKFSLFELRNVTDQSSSTVYYWTYLTSHKHRGEQLVTLGDEGRANSSRIKEETLQCDLIYTACHLRLFQGIHKPSLFTKGNKKKSLEKSVITFQMTPLLLWKTSDVEVLFYKPKTCLSRKRIYFLIEKQCHICPWALCGITVQTHLLWLEGYAKTTGLIKITKR